MSQTVNNVALEVLLAMGYGTPDSSQVTITERYVSDVYQDMADFCPWPFFRQDETINTVAATAQYNLQASADMVLSIRRADNDDWIEETSKEKLAMYRYDLEEQGNPLCFFVVKYDSTINAGVGGCVIQLWPVPSSVIALTVNEERRAQQLATGNTIPFPDGFLPVIKAGVRAKLLGDDKDYNGVQIEFRNYAAGLQALKLRYFSQESRTWRRLRSDIPRVIGLMPGRLDPSHYEN